MANRRMIYKDFFDDDYFGTADPLMRLLWIGLIAAVADDQGRILDNSSLIKAKVFVYDRDINEEIIDSFLSDLSDAGKITRYTSNNKQLIQIVKWWDYQSPSWANHSKFPAPDNWIDRIRCHVSGDNQGGKVETINWDRKGGYNKLPSKLPSIQPSGIDELSINLVKNRLNEFKATDPKDNDLYDQCKQIYEQKKGRLITDGHSFSLMIKNFKEKEVMPEDYAAAIDAMDADKRYNGSKPTSYESWALGYADKRKNPKQFKSGSTKKTNEQIIEEMMEHGEI